MKIEPVRSFKTLRSHEVCHSHSVYSFHFSMWRFSSLRRWQYWLKQLFAILLVSEEELSMHMGIQTELLLQQIQVLY